MNDRVESLVDDILKMNNAYSQEDDWYLKMQKTYQVAPALNNSLGTLERAYMEENCSKHVYDKICDDFENYITVKDSISKLF